ncbi:MAG: ectoine/hydroxyectoine ABC transporter substrate-binding protein EhuB [Trueperaceae bacterium]|nr:ectoine/hydroxyectoine ABC transporter substrate-binding protein EhuB [Trueperaceae bacterium]
MKRLSTLLIAALTLGLVTGFGLAQRSWSDIQESGTVRVVTANEIPYGWIDDEGVAHGIAPEVAIAVLESMGITDIEWTVTEFGQLIPSLIAGRADMTAASMAILPDRCQQVDYARPNSSYGEGFLVAAGNPQDIHSYQDFVDNPDLTMGIVSGADQIDFAQAMGIPQNQISFINANADAPSAVSSGRIDAYAGTGLTVANLADSSDRVEIADPFEDPVVDGEPVRSWGSFNFHADADDFSEAFDAALGEFQQTDEYRDILLSHGLSDGDIDAALAASTEDLCSAE